MKLISGFRLTAIDAHLKGSVLECGLLYVERDCSEVESLGGVTVRLPADMVGRSLSGVAIDVNLEVISGQIFAN